MFLSFIISLKPQNYIKHNKNQHILFICCLLPFSITKRSKSLLMNSKEL